jgi:hypothetical protein
MGHSAARKKLTIFDLMVIVVALAVVIRAVVEVPRIVQESSSTRAAAQCFVLAAEFEAKGDLNGATSLRDFAAKRLEIARANRPDPIGYACYVCVLTGAAVILLVSFVILVRREIHKRSRRADNPSSSTVG